MRFYGMAIGEMSFVTNGDGASVSRSCWLQPKLWGKTAERSGRIGDKAISDATHGEEVLGMGRIIFDIPTEANDEIINRSSVGIFMNPPDLFENFFARDDLALAFGKVTQEVRLHDGELGDTVGSDQL